MDLPTWIAVPKREFAERLMDFQHFLFSFSLVLFADTYLLVLYKTDIREINIEWILSHLTVQPALAFLGCLLFFYSTLLPGIQIVSKFGAGFFKKEAYVREEGYVSLDDLKKYAMRNDNAVIYQEVQSRIKENKKLVHMHAICLGLVILCVVGYLFSTAAHQGLIQFLNDQIEGMPWYLEWPAKLITVPPMLGVFLIAIASRDSGANYMYVRGFEKWVAAGETKRTGDLGEDLRTDV